MVFRSQQIIFHDYYCYYHQRQEKSPETAGIMIGAGMKTAHEPCRSKNIMIEYRQKAEALFQEGSIIWESI